MTNRRKLIVKATHRYVEDPGVEQTLEVWVKLLAEAMRKRLTDRPGSPRSGSPAL